ncbi:MAG TPA: transporter substrate-binding domain-containing protein [Aggregatilinea sp.]|uniref:substrate-binding periplasmic protein n=1 Tax=Aggregatilinea sp. TaxID=2806333 RepID=UPI002C80941F|nr:transporter substrate-binding domain-containing protein [Aggregatilinea sp.]HML21686.1 transporter substrate-binding domain-containing protein [Aggregatilinea sp.]
MDVMNPNVTQAHPRMARRTGPFAPLIAALLLAALVASGCGSPAAAQGPEATEEAGPIIVEPIGTAEVEPLITSTPTPTATNTPEPSTTPTVSAPTLVPPTLVPSQLTPTPSTPYEQSGLINAQESQTLRVGTYYNAYPFAWLNETGEIDGYEADIMRAIEIELGISVQWVQVTRQNDITMLLNGDVDVLIGTQVHSRDRDNLLDYTHPYYLNEERMVVRADSPYSDLASMAGVPVAVEIGTRSERVLRQWMEQTGISMDIRTYMSQNAALDALATGEVEGMVGPLDSLRRAGRQQMRLIDQVVAYEPYAIAMRRFDVNLRNVLDRSLQRLKASGRLDEIFDQWFPSDDMNFDALVPVYGSLYEDERVLADFNADMPYPASSIMDRIQSGQPIRVAGIMQEGEEAPAGVRITNALNKAMVEEMARRWGAQIEYVPNSAQNAVDLVANGEADLAVGVSPRWDGADRVEYSLPYIQHGNRLMVPANSEIEGFSDMRGTGWWIGFFADSAGDEDRILQLAEMFNVKNNVSTFAIQREDEAVYTMVVEDNIKAIFGDSLRLLALAREADPDSVKILDTPYGDVLPITLALPRNDADFRALVDFTLQDMAQDGTYQRLWSETFALGDPLTILPWPQVNPDSHVSDAAMG